MWEGGEIEERDLRKKQNNIQAEKRLINLWKRENVWEARIRRQEWGNRCWISLIRKNWQYGIEERKRENERRRRRNWVSRTMRSSTYWDILNTFGFRRIQPWILQWVSKNPRKKGNIFFASCFKSSWDWCVQIIPAKWLKICRGPSTQWLKFYTHWLNSNF
jgi:hypothetical protein